VFERLFRPALFYGVLISMSDQKGDDEVGIGRFAVFNSSRKPAPEMLLFYRAADYSIADTTQSFLGCVKPPATAGGTDKNPVVIACGFDFYDLFRSQKQRTKVVLEIFQNRSDRQLNPPSIF
jgi:hypothetical protein